MKKRIKEFKNDYRFLSNFYPSEVDHEGVIYSTVEHAFQAAKTIDQEERETICKASTPGQAKRLGRQVDLREDWEKVKEGTMFSLVFDKFQRHKDLRTQLLDTNESRLVEGNYWHDNYWGSCYCKSCIMKKGVNKKGVNRLGQILERVRKILWEQQ